MSGPRILVVEDDPNVRGLLQTLLEVEGYAVVTASDGLDGLGRAAASSPALVLLDLVMPDLGGARVLGRDDIGALAPGMSADLVAFDLRGVGHAGAGHDPVAALVFCQPGAASLNVIDGRVRIRDGRFTDLELAPLLARHRALARTLYERAHHPHLG